MIAYEDLVASLSSWRASQGLPANAVHFASAASGSVDLALPIAEPMETLGTGEVEALDADEYAVDEYAVDENAIDEYAADEYAADAESDVIGEPDENSPVSNVLDYGDDESEQTAIASDFQGAGPAPTPPELAAADVDQSEAEAISMDDEEAIAVEEVQVEEAAANPSSSYPEAHTEEVEMLSEFEDEDSEEQEAPTKFSGMEGESTVMGIGIDKLVSPGPSTDTEE